jgi:hypothetical protein
MIMISIWCIRMIEKQLNMLDLMKNGLKKESMNDLSVFK